MRQFFILNDTVWTLPEGGTLTVVDVKLEFAVNVLGSACYKLRK